MICCSVFETYGMFGPFVVIVYLSQKKNNGTLIRFSKFKMNTRQIYCFWAVPVISRATSNRLESKKSTFVLKTITYTWEIYRNKNRDVSRNEETMW